MLPLKSKYYEVGIAVRGAFRRACLQLELDYKEEKGFIVSGFRVTGEEGSIEILDNWIKRNF